MAQIQPISTWYQGQQREANVFTVNGSYNNLISFGNATFQYQLIELIINDEQQSSQTLVTGEFSINEQDYEDWTNSTDSNAWIYNWAANKLGLTIITL